MLWTLFSHVFPLDIHVFDTWHSQVCLLAAMMEHGHYLLADYLRAPRLARAYLAGVGLWMAAVLYVFWFFSPVTYGSRDLTANEVMSLAWRDTWDLIIHK